MRSRRIAHAISADCACDLGGLRMRSRRIAASPRQARLLGFRADQHEVREQHDQAALTKHGCQRCHLFNFVAAVAAAAAAVVVVAAAAAAEAAAVVEFRPSVCDVVLRREWSKASGACIVSVSSTNSQFVCCLRARVTRAQTEVGRCLHNVVE